MKFKGLVVTLCISLFLAIASPFYVSAEGAESDDAGYIACLKFFSAYGLRPYSEDYFLLNCISGSTSEYCTIYSQESELLDDQDMFTVLKTGTTGFVSVSSYTTNNRFRTTTEPMYIVFLSNTNFTTANSTIYPQSGYTVDFERVTNNTQTVMTPNGYYLITFKITATTTPSSGTTWASLSIAGSNTTTVIPLYKGPEIAMPDNIHRVVFGTGQTYNVSDTLTHSQLSSLYSINTAINNVTGQINSKLVYTNQYLKDMAQGTTASNTASSNLNNKTSELTTQINSYNQLEDGFKDTMEDSLNDIDFNSSLMNDGNLINSMLWVKQRYDRMTRSTIFGSIIQYSLLFGLGMLIIGRDKK